MNRKFFFCLSLFCFQAHAQFDLGGWDFGEGYCDNLLKRAGLRITGYTIDGDPIINGRPTQYDADSNQINPDHNLYAQLTDGKKAKSVRRTFPVRERTPEELAEYDKNFRENYLQSIKPEKNASKVEAPFWVDSEPLSAEILGNTMFVPQDAKFYMVHPERKGQIPRNLPFYIGGQTFAQNVFYVGHPVMSIAQSKANWYIPAEIVHAWVKQNGVAQGNGGIPNFWTGFPNVPASEKPPHSFVENFIKKYEYRQGKFYSRTNTELAPAADVLEFLRLTKDSEHEIRTAGNVPASLVEYLEAIQPHPGD
jgi:hypothetical protein